MAHESWPDFWDVYAAGGWEPWTLEIVGGVTGRYVDVGAWIGPTVIAAKNASERVAVEPDPLARKMLYANLREAGIVADVHAVAVADVPGRAVLRSARGMTLGASETTMLPHGDGLEFTVPAVTLESLGAAELIKIDIEGAEAFVLPQARGWLDGTQPVLVSLHPDWYSKAEFDAVVAVLSDYPDISVDGGPGPIPREFCTVYAR